jgi:hypothetical protein
MLLTSTTTHHPAENLVTGDKVLARRRQIRRDRELPMKDDYSAVLRKLIAENNGLVRS